MSVGAATETRLLNARETALRLGISARSVWELTKSGKLRSIRPTPCSVRYAEADIADFIQSLRQAASAS